MTDLFALPAPYPESVLLSIYNAYPRRTGRPAALKRITEALDRICQGEIDGAPRTQAEAIEFLRLKTEEARAQLGGKSKNWIPHPATWYNQSRYLRKFKEEAEMPKRMNTCVQILAQYPKSPKADHIRSNFQSFLPALVAIDKALDRIKAQDSWSTDEFAAGYLEGRVRIYAEAVSTWAPVDLQYVPNAAKFFNEARYDQPEQSWQRQPVNDYKQEREQLRNITI